MPSLWRRPMFRPFASGVDEAVESMRDVLELGLLTGHPDHDTGPAPADRLRKLEEGGYIEGYYTRVDPKMLGRDITAFIFVSVDSSKHYNSFLDHAHANDDILECHAVTGEGSHLLKIRTENTATLEKLLAKIQSWQGVTGTRTSVVLSTSKETTRLKIHNSK